MTLYNLTNLTATNTTTNLANFVCQINYISNFSWAIVVMLMIFIVATIIIVRLGYTIYTSLPVSCFLASMVATLFRWWSCNDYGMVSTFWVIVFWVLTALFIALRVAIKD